MSDTGVWAILVAAGRGERLGGERPKAFAKLGDRPLLAESLERLEDSEWIEAIVVVVHEDWVEPAILLAEELGAGKVNACVPGGETRADSVRLGMGEVPNEAAVVLVHDAARPFLPPEVIDRVRQALGEGWTEVVPALEVADTLKRARADGAVIETVERVGLYGVQTPQAFVAETFRRALAGRADRSTPTARGSSRQAAAASGSSRGTGVWSK